MQYRILILLSIFCTPLAATEFQHLIGASYLNDQPSASEIQPTGYGLRYQLSINDKWIIDAAYSKSSDFKEQTSKPRSKYDYNSEFINLGLTYQLDDYYMDMQLFQFDDYSFAASGEDKAMNESTSDGFGIAIGIGSFYEWQDFSVNYGVTIAGNQMDVDQKQRELVDGKLNTLDAISQSQQAAATLGGSLSYFYAFEDWALMPRLGINWTQILGENEEHSKLRVKQDGKNYNLLRRGGKFTGLLAGENSGVIDLGLDLMHYRGFSLGLFYSVGFASSYDTQAWVIETSYSF
ncbi:porin family protein [Paraferrimonas sp. SM1919]|uniref:porin family protein n=1 Tax=Paraferrimonas sp. SM1919 TaxID=2662263 RepID=UPI0013D0EAAD|nr:porin family protein [Paraferrimonas sp. SM1919]